MGFKSDIEIAQQCEMLPITQIAEKAGIDDKYLEQYGKYKAKLDYNLLKETDKPGRRSAGLYRCFAPMKSAAESRWRTPLLLCRLVHGPKAPEKAKPIPVRV